jgi:DNA repair exonuclease SbcCD nuclease subunit
VSWKADYPSEIWSSLAQVGQFARQYEVTAVLDGGDYFHIKAATRNPHTLVEKTARIHAEYPCDTWSVEGNHDISYNNLDTVARQPIGVLYATGVFKHLREQVFEKGDVRVRVVGMPYSPFRTLEDLRAIRKQPGDTHLVAIVHALAGADPPPNVEEFFGEPVFRYEDLLSPEGPDVYCFGHWHKDQGIVEIDGKLFVNQGALSRGALSRENLDRTPKVALLEFVVGSSHVKALPLQVAPASEVFDIERNDRQTREAVEIDQFITKLQANATFNVADTIEANLATLDFAKDVRDFALEYLERARTET